jgi:hypothetical protein
MVGRNIYRRILQPADTSVCRGSTPLDEAVKCSDLVVFYGHGLKDQWIGLPDQVNPTGPSIPIVDAASVKLLDGLKVYASCCHSLVGLGKAYGAYSPSAPGFVDYDSKFGFDASNHEYFRNVVNHAAINFVKGTTHQDIQTLLLTSWSDLRDSFGSGLLKNRPNAHVATKYADDNSKCVGAVP